jgi:hypothetical protein
MNHESGKIKTADDVRFTIKNTQSLFQLRHGTDNCNGVYE